MTLTIQNVPQFLQCSGVYYCGCIVEIQLVIGGCIYNQLYPLCLLMQLFDQYTVFALAQSYQQIMELPYQGVHIL